VDIEDSGETGENDTPDSAHADRAPKPRKARLGVAVEIVTGLSFLLSLLVLLIAVIDRSAMPAWVFGAWILLFVGGLCWEAFVGGLILTFWPHLMAGSQLELWWLSAGSARRVAGPILAWTGINWAILAAYSVANNAHVISAHIPSTLLFVWIMIATVPFFVLFLVISFVSGRHSGTRHRRIRS
jgi:hypothetical protein